MVLAVSITITDMISRRNQFNCTIIEIKAKETLIPTKINKLINLKLINHTKNNHQQVQEGKCKLELSKNRNTNIIHKEENYLREKCHQMHREAMHQDKIKYNNQVIQIMMMKFLNK